MAPAPRHDPARRRRIARLAAAQALYQIEVAGVGADAVLLEFLQHRLEEEIDEGLRLADMDRDLFSDLVKGVSSRKPGLDEMLTPLLAPDWTLGRLELLLRVILRAGAYELAHRSDVPPKVAISEYVELAHDFFGGREPALVNGVLDRLARLVRAEAFG
ncbi:transcription antitermination factor NusB [Algihabitans albus]|uniref:transcription antitermination factor NusB n=1 Tax=Algihabitans albus TaxID=2164067 RepID=UPI000E5C8C19|nr:transcription antitermination factor NusB [Algihabitans albus]